MKRAPRGGGSIRQRSDGRWEGRYSPGYDPLTGKRKYRSVYGNTQAEVRKKLAKSVAEIDEGRYSDQSKKTVFEWVEEWLTDYKSNLRESSRRSYRSILRLYLLPPLGKKRLSDVTPYQIQGILNSADLAPSSKAALRNVMTGLFGDAARVGLIQQNPVSRATLPKKERHKITILSDEDISRVLAACDRTEYAELFRFLAFTGVRISEALGLTWDRIDFEHGFITIDRQLTPIDTSTVTFSPTKTGKSRKLCPAPSVMERLRKHRAAQAEQFLASGCRCAQGLVFCNAIGKPYSTWSVRDALRDASASVGVPMKPHDFRHNYAAMALRAGDDPRTVQEALGHATAAFTLEVYAAVNDQMRTESAARMDAFMARFNP